MKASIITLVLALMLLLSSFAIGLTFQGGTGREGKSPTGSGPGSGPALGTLSQPLFVVRAVEVSPSYLLAASLLRNVPGYMFAPLSGVTVAIAGLLSVGIARRGIPYNNQLVTNSSGIGEGVEPRGNFTIHVRASNFNFSTPLGFAQGRITYLNLTVVPFSGNVSSITLMNQDTLSGIQPTAMVYATVEGNPVFENSSLAELLALGPSQSHRPSAPPPLLTIDLTILGTYPSPEGMVIAMKPQSAYSFLPSTGLTLIQFRANSKVSYLVG